MERVRTVAACQIIRQGTRSTTRIFASENENKKFTHHSAKNQDKVFKNNHRREAAVGLQYNRYRLQKVDAAGDHSGSLLKPHVRLDPFGRIVPATAAEVTQKRDQ
jgi:hypothetical protein